MASGNSRRGPRPGGVGEYFLPYGETITVETYTCRHCQAIIDTTPKSKSMIPTCDHCHSHVCPLCKVKGDCLPFEKLCEIDERSDVQRATALGPLGEEYLRFLIEREKSRTQFFVDLKAAS